MLNKVKKLNKKLKKRGGSLFTFNYNDKIGGLPSVVPLTNTKDGDCPNNIKLNGGSRKKNRTLKQKLKHTLKHKKTKKTKK